jgi:hypothetical protein
MQVGLSKKKQLKEKTDLIKSAFVAAGITRNR